MDERRVDERGMDGGRSDTSKHGNEHSKDAKRGKTTEKERRVQTRLGTRG